MWGQDGHVGLSQPQSNSSAIFVQGQRCRVSGREGGDKTCVCQFSQACSHFSCSCGTANVFLCAILCVRFSLCAGVCVCVCVAQSGSHPVRGCSEALSHPHTSLPFLRERPSVYIFTTRDGLHVVLSLKYVNVHRMYCYSKQCRVCTDIQMRPLFISHTTAENSREKFKS